MACHSNAVATMDSWLFLKNNPHLKTVPAHMGNELLRRVVANRRIVANIA